MRICFTNGEWVEFELSGPVAPVLEHMYEYLQNVALPWRPWDSPIYQASPAAALVQAGAVLGIDVDEAQCRDQLYLNSLHAIYERKYDGRPAWMDYHENIHRCERPILTHLEPMPLDHRELAGPVQQPFDLEWLTHGTTCVERGTVFVAWAELGKIPYQYWLDGEPDSLERMCELVKPWLALKGRIMVALENKDFFSYVRRRRHMFNDWWQQYETAWCRHWGIDSWSLEQQRTVVPIGHMQPKQCDQVLEWLGQGHYPSHVRL